MDASVIIVTKNQKEYLIKTLPVLKKQTFKGEYEIIVIDSGSTDGAREYCIKQQVKVVDIHTENFSYAHAFNTGAACAKGKYLIRLSGDCVPMGNKWLDEIIKSFEDDSVGGVFGKYVISERRGYTYPNFWPAWRFPKGKTRYSIKSYPFIGLTFLNISLSPKVYEFAGGCCAVRRDVWEKRPFNEKLTAGEDAEYSWFLHIVGYDIVYNPKIEVLHEHKIDHLGSIRAYSGLSRWSLLFTSEIFKYWIKRIFGANPYRDFKNPFTP